MLIRVAGLKGAARVRALVCDVQSRFLFKLGFRKAANRLVWLVCQNYIYALIVGTGSFMEKKKVQVGRQEYRSLDPLIMDARKGIRVHVFALVCDLSAVVLRVLLTSLVVLGLAVLGL